jgi:hypothetical protein
MNWESEGDSRKVLPQIACAADGRDEDWRVESAVLLRLSRECRSRISTAAIKIPKRKL